MNHSNISLGGTAIPSSAGFQMPSPVPSLERKPELIRAFGEYENLLDRLAFNINQLEDRLAQYCSLREEKNEASPCSAPYTSGAAARLANTNDALSHQIRRLEALLPILEL